MPLRYTAHEAVPPAAHALCDRIYTTLRGQSAPLALNVLVHVLTEVALESGVDDQVVEALTAALAMRRQESSRAMKTIDEFKNADGTHDWAAYGEQKIAVGYTCYQCRGVASIIGAPGHRQLCYSCKELESERDEVDHDDFIRCPKCGHRDRISEWDCDFSEVKYAEGEHTVTCGECEHDYEISTHASYSYTSPARLDEKERT